jgi:copper chaperone CopZ
MKNIKSFVLVFVTLFTYINYSQAINLTQTNENLKTITIKVKGLTCSNDLKTISKNIEKLKGVISCETGKMGATSSFKVKFDPELVTEKEIYAAIENTGGCENPDDRPYRVKNKG